MPLKRLSKRQRELLELLVAEYQRGYTKFLAVVSQSGWGMILVGEGVGQKNPSVTFDDGDLNDLYSEGYIHMDRKSSGSIGGSVTPKAREDVGTAAGDVPETVEITPLPEPLPVRHEFGGFRIVDVIQKGGQGTVYKALDIAIDELVALKVLSRDGLAKEDGADRFKAEVKTTRRLKHPNICSIYALGDHGGTLYYSMELLDGSTIRDVFKLSDTDLPAILDVLRALGSALDYMHGAGVIHRDLSDGNVMLAASGPVILDLGYAKDSTRRSMAMTKANVPFGTPTHMSPEQWRGEILDHRADIYSFGIIAYQLLSGQLPFPATDAASAMYQHLYEPPNLLAVADNFRPALGQALAKARDNRYASAGLFANALVMSTMTVTSHMEIADDPPPSSGPQPQRINDTSTYAKTWNERTYEEQAVLLWIWNSDENMAHDHLMTAEMLAWPARVRKATLVHLREYEYIRRVPETDNNFPGYALTETSEAMMAWLTRNGHA